MGELVDRVVRKNTNNESTLPLTISAQYGLVDQITYFNNRVASRDVSNYYLVLNGEFAYNKSTSDGYPFGAVKRLDLYEKGVLSTLYIVFAPKKEQQIDSNYLTVFFDTDRWHKGVAERAAEGARNHGLLNISAEDFFDIDLSVPKDIVEQKQIGAFIRQLDNLITLHQRECISFTARAGRLILTANKKRNTSSWEQRKLGELTSLITKGTTPLDKSNIGTVNFVKIESIDNSSGEITITQKISSEEHEGYLRRSQLKENDILFSIAGTLGRVTSVKSSILPANTNQALAIIRLKSGCLKYVKTYLKGKAVADFIKKNPTIGAQPNLSLEQVSNLDIALPSEIEQEQIGAFFEQLDNLITLHQRKGKAAVSGCSNDANNSKGVYCKARDFGYKCYKEVKSQQIRCLIAVFIFCV